MFIKYINLHKIQLYVKCIYFINKRLRKKNAKLSNAKSRLTSFPCVSYEATERVSRWQRVYSVGLLRLSQLFVNSPYSGGKYQKNRFYFHLKYFNAYFILQKRKKKLYIKLKQNNKYIYIFEFNKFHGEFITFKFNKDHIHGGQLPCPPPTYATDPLYSN